MDNVGINRGKTVNLISLSSSQRWLLEHAAATPYWLAFITGA
eukprot:SAG31_NODE_42520_length_271_cov_0.610465_1_plen_41_part_01